MKKRKIKKTKKIDIKKVLYILLFIAMLVLTIYAVKTRVAEISSSGYNTFEFLFPTMR